jgi:hypothetical protein
MREEMFSGSRPKRTLPVSTARPALAGHTTVRAVKARNTAS